MSAEIQTGLFILTAELAGVTTLAALGAGIVAWARRKGRIKAAEALRAAADRLPGEGEILQKEKALLGEFARAYLTRDADALGALPKALLDLRQMHEAVQVSGEAADTQQAEALQAEKEALQARTETLEKQLALTAQQLEGTLATINTLVQEYGRGRGQTVTPTAEALLQALLSMQGEGAERPSGQEEIKVAFQDAGSEAAPVDDEAAIESMDLSIDDVVAGDVPLDEVPVTEEAAAIEAGGEPEPEPEEQPAAPQTPEAAKPVSNDDIDALLMDVLGESAAPTAAPPATPAETAEPETALEAEAEAEGPVETTAPAPAPAEEDLMDLSVPVEEPPATEAPRDELDDLDIDALLDAELGRQAKLLTPASVPNEDLDLSRTEDLPGKK